MVLPAFGVTPRRRFGETFQRPFFGTVGQVYHPTTLRWVGRTVGRWFGGVGEREYGLATVRWLDGKAVWLDTSTEVR